VLLERVRRSAFSTLLLLVVVEHTDMAPVVLAA
jgi:hypothetical protein